MLLHRLLHTIDDPFVTFCCTDLLIKLKLSLDVLCRKRDADLDASCDATWWGNNKSQV